MSVEPTFGPPVSHRVSRADALWGTNSRYRKIGPAIGYEVTFADEFWDNGRTWQDQNVWGSPPFDLVNT